ncbi:HigA family addiction module antitoxin [Fodinicurvata sediminis]|uniref:HigA family addiction module antitoxin n=1 Tax=Fodinicurvata sediminis TaxID=1121832 RepID=UPI0009DC05E4
MNWTVFVSPPLCLHKILFRVHTLGGDRRMFVRAVHPGIVLKNELEELGLTPMEFARQIDVPPSHVSQIIAGKHAVTSDAALRFGQWFGDDPQFFREPI